MIKRKPKKSKPKIRSLIKKLDKVFSIYIRRKYADNRGMVRCFTCNKQMRWQDAQNSHYISRRHMSTRFLEKNCHPSCLACNVFLHGNMDVYAIKLQATYGDTILIDLQREKNKIKRWTILELNELINFYKNKLS